MTSNLELYLSNIDRGLQDIAERKFVRDAARFVVARFGNRTVIVNIGVARGSSLHCLRAGAPDALLIGIDINFKRYPLIGDPRAQLIRGRSQDVQITGPVHLVFVDGGHRWNSVRGDIKNWAPRVLVGGFMLFHDHPSPVPVRPRSGPRKEYLVVRGVARATAEWKRSPGWAARWRELGMLGTIASFERIAEG